MNHIHLIGRLGADPKLSPYADHWQSEDEGAPRKNVVTFDLAVERRGARSRTTDGQVDWVPVTIFDGSAGRFAGQHLKKGDRVAVTGRLETRLWNPEGGSSRRTFNVIVTEVIGLNTPRREQEETSSSANSRRGEPASTELVSSTSE